MTDVAEKQLLIYTDNLICILTHFLLDKIFTGSTTFCANTQIFIHLQYVNSKWLIITIILVPGESSAWGCSWWLCQRVVPGWWHHSPCSCPQGGYRCERLVQLWPFWVEMAANNKKQSHPWISSRPMLKIQFIDINILLTWHQHYEQYILG